MATRRHPPTTPPRSAPPAGSPDGPPDQDIDADDGLDEDLDEDPSRPHAESRRTRKIRDGKRCEAMTRQGNPCQSLALAGSTRCRVHGGNSRGGDRPLVTEGLRRMRSGASRPFFGLPQHIADEIDVRADQADIMELGHTLALSERMVALQAAPVFDDKVVERVAANMAGDGGRRGDEDDGEPQITDADRKLAQAKLARAASMPLAEHGRLQAAAAKAAIVRQEFQRAIVPLMRQLGEGMRHILLKLRLPPEQLSQALTELDAVAVEALTRMVEVADLDADLVPGARSGEDDEA